MFRANGVQGPALPGPLCLSVPLNEKCIIPHRCTFYASPLI